MSGKGSSSTSSGSGGIYLPQAPEKIKNLFDAISEIEFYAASEEEGDKISEKFFTTKQKLQFMEVGFKSAFISGMITALLSPLMVGVFEKIIPVFGSYNPTLIDQIYVFLLTVGFSLGYGIFIARVGKCYSKKYSISKSMVNNLMAGLTAGALLKAIFVFFLFHFIYFSILTPENVAKALVPLAKKGFFSLSFENVEKIFIWIMEFRKTFLTAAWFVVFTSLLLVVIPFFKILKTVIKEKRIKQVEDL
ncbi:MAG: hypothetical protein HPY60_11315 [Candidatus Methanofastidiosum sp.]|nr:hypothetical protein [Methanofastidiosum sp.]